MPLLSLGEIQARAYLACPVCHAPLWYEDGGVARCSDHACRCSSEAFEYIGRWPVLLDYEDTVFMREDISAKRGESLIRRRKRGAVKSRAIDFFFGRNEVAPLQIKRMVDLLKADSQRPVILVVGGGTIGSGLQALYEHPQVDLLSFDVYPSEYTQFIADAHRIPLRTASVDGAVVQAVLEHVLEPQNVAAEIHRVLKDKGVVYSETPFLQQVHESAYDFTRFTESGHRYLFKEFDLIDSGVVHGTGTQALWTLMYLASGLFRTYKAAKVSVLLFFWLRFLDRVIPRRFATDAASAFYFLGRKSARSMKKNEIVKFYKGAK
jgi:SAM-dependent methyltransferase